MDIEPIIEKAYSDSKSDNKSLAVASLFNIIQIKAENIEYLNKENSIYNDIRQFVFLYIDSVVDNDYGYNFISISKITEAIESNPDIEQRLDLYNKSIQELKNRGFNKESRKLESGIKKTHIKSLFKSCKLINILKAIVCSLFFNVWTVSLFILVFFISYVVITLPLSNNEDCLFLLDYNNHCDYFLLNHIFNIFGDLFEYNSNKFCNPNNICGIFVALLYKFIFVVYAGWFVKKISEKFKFTISDYEE